MESTEECLNVIRELCSNWTYNVMLRDDSKRHFLGLGKKNHYEGSVQFETEHEGNPIKWSYSTKGDFRVWYKTPTELVQWRTDPEKGNRFVVTSFRKGTTADTAKVSLDKFFPDTQNPTEDQLAMFMMIYPEMFGKLEQFISGAIGLEQMRKFKKQ